VKLFTSSLDVKGLSLIHSLKYVFEHYPSARFELVFLIHTGQGWGISSKFGVKEIERDKWLVCAQNINPYPEAFFPLLICIGRDLNALPSSTYFHNCALGHGYDPYEIESCYTDHGLEMLYDSWIIYHQGEMNIENPTLVIDNSIVIINQSSITLSIMEALCYHFHNPDEYVISYWIPTFSACLFSQFLILFWIVKKTPSGMCNMLGLCYESEHTASEEDLGEAVIQQWNERGDDGDVGRQEEFPDPPEIEISESGADTRSVSSSEEEGPLALGDISLLEIN